MDYQKILKEIEVVKKKFENHILTPVITSDNFKIYNFRNENGSSVYYQRWIFDNGTLIVTGDCYDSIYRWGASIDLESISKMGVDYFSSKCVSCRNGYNQKEFDSGYAEELLKEIATEYIKYNHDSIDDLCKCENDETCVYCDDHKWNELSNDEKFNFISEIIKEELDIDDFDLDSVFYYDFENEAMEFMSENENIFGCDTFEHDLKTMTWEPIHHYAALHVAYEKFGNKI